MNTDLSWLSPIAKVEAVVEAVVEDIERATSEQAPDPGIYADYPLDGLIVIAVRLWGYDDDDRRRINEIAERDPDGLRLSLLADPMVLQHLSARCGRGAP